MTETKIDQINRLASHMRRLADEAKGSVRIMAAYPFKTMAEEGLEEAVLSLRQTADELETLLTEVKHERTSQSAQSLDRNLSGTPEPASQDL